MSPQEPESRRDPERTPRSSPAAEPATPPPDAEALEPVQGAATGLLREVGRMEDGRRITYYWSRAGSPA